MGSRMIITQNQTMKQLIQHFIYNPNIIKNKEPLIFLLQGETGTGKELFAREIHRASKATGKFVPINCAAITEGLFLSHFFGHRKGAFTGAIENRKGAFEEAENGTLFLDEMGEIPLELQAVLLRALEEKKGYRVGELDKERHYRVHRIICATNVELNKAVATKQFRRDLYHRIKELVIEIPPLRERSDDIPLLIEHFLKQIVKENGTTSHKEMPDDLNTIFSSYEWPGNVRELQQELKSLFLRSQGKNLDPIFYSRELKRHIALEYYKLQPIDSYKIHLPGALETLVEKLAKNTHETWALKRRAEGWVFGLERNDNKKTNTCLINYEFLPDSEKEVNRKIVREIIKAILACDYLLIEHQNGLAANLKQLENTLIKHALFKYAGNLSQAAQDLAIDRAALSRKVSANTDLKVFLAQMRKNKSS